MKPHLHYLILFFLVFLISCSEKELSRPKSNNKSITSFTITNLSPNVVAVVDTIAHTVQLTFPIGTDLTNLTPTITTSPKSSVTPATNAPQDFSKSINYVVTAEDGTTQSYTVNATVLKSADKRIVSFSFAGLSPVVNAVIDTVNHRISAVMPVYTDITALVPTINISSDRATISPNSNIVQDFSKPINYVVTAEDGTTQSYTVIVTVTKSSERKITSFVFKVGNNAISSKIYEENDLIDVLLPPGTDVSKLAPVIAVSKNATVLPASGSVQDFSTLVVYTVTAENGVSRKYNVRVETTAAVSDAPAKGKTEINDNFVVKTVVVKRYVWPNETGYSIIFYDQQVGCYTSQLPPISFSFPKLELGYVKQSSYFLTEKALTQYPISDVEITKITSTTVEGKVRGGNIKGKEYLEGSFSAIICN